MTDHTSKTNESPQVGTHGSAPGHDETRTAGGDTTNDTSKAWNDRSQDERVADQTDALERDMQRGGMTKEPQPSGTMPLERDQRPINQSR
jgi:hypothetical protein